MRLILRWLITAIALGAAVLIVPGITVEGDAPLYVAATAVILGLVNALVRPLLRLLSCPFILLTLGLFLFVVNPEITRRSMETVTAAEGCLSIPGYLGDVERHASVSVAGLNRRGKPFQLKAPSAGGLGGEDATTLLREFVESYRGGSGPG